jgi:hypothetical protein
LALERRAKVLSDFQQNLAQKMIPTATVIDETAKGAIKLAIVSMTLVISEIRRDIMFTTTFFSTLLDSWAGVWKWIQFLHARCVIGKEYGETLQLQSFRIIPWIIAALCKDHDIGLRKVLARTPGIFNIIVPHWLDEGTDKNLMQLNPDYNYSAALKGLLMLEEHHDAKILADIVEAADGGAEAVASVAMGHLRHIIVMDHPDLTQVQNHMWLVSAFASSLCPPLRSAMLHHMVLPTIIDALNVIGGQPTYTFIHPGLVTLSYRTLSEVLESVNGPSWISQALDMGMLPAMLRSGLRLKAPGVPVFMARMAPQRLFELLQQYLVYRSVLRSLAKALQKVDRCNIGPRLSGPFWSEWVAFKAVAEERLHDKAEFDAKYASGATPGFFGCSAQDVSLKTKIL